MLLQNLSVFTQYPVRQSGQNNADMRFCWGHRTDTANNRFVSMAGFVPHASIPYGYRPEYSWAPALKAGGMSMRATGSSTLAASLIPTRPMTIDITGSGGLTADASLAVSMSVDMTGSGTLTANILGLLDMSVDFTGSGDLSAALSAIASMGVALSGSGDLDATISGIANMELDIVVTGTGLTLENVSTAVWESLASSFNTPGTMGEKLNDAGSAGNPWASLLASNNSPGSFGEFVQALPDADTVAAALLDFANGVETGRTPREALRLMLAALAGKISGAGTSTITIRDAADTKDRITATVDSNGNRTALTYDDT